VDFAIRFGYERVVLYVEPQVEPGRLEANTARTLLLLDHEPLPWTRWGEEFAANMPNEILRLQERAASADGTPRQEAIRGRVTPLLPLYRLSRYRPAQRTRSTSPNNSAATSEQPAETATSTTLDAPAPATLGSAAENDAASTHERDASSEMEEADLPDVAWVSWRDGTRAPGDLEDQAARYHPSRHELTINADFRAITDMVAYWRRRYEGVPGSRTVIEAQVREWFEQLLVEVVLSVRNSRWNDEQAEALLSPVAFSAALLPRHLVHAMLQKRLAQKLGGPPHD